jgi:4-amino-4-deoxy-L-arabinose transferase-like glycosyltransferase
MTRSRAFAIALIVITVAGFVLRLAYVWYARRGSCDTFAFDTGCPGDARVYHLTANLLAEGKGFINPITYLLSHGKTRVAAADHPPLFELILAAVSFVGFKTWLAHQLVVVCIGTCSIAVAGWLGRDVFGDRVGLVAAGLVALDPNVWINDGNVMSESLTILTVLLATWAAYRFWRAPDLRRSVVLGLAVGVTTLVRPEMSLLVVAVVLPLALWSRSLSFRDRVVRFAAAAVVAGVVVAPWAAYNTSRFHHPVVISTGLGTTLVDSNCDPTFYGQFIGYYSLTCTPRLPTRSDFDQSDAEVLIRRRALDYIDSHRRRLPVVVLARIGRTWNLFHVSQGVDLDVFEGRPRWASLLGLAAFYPLLALAGYGAVVARRRRVALTPLVGPFVIVTFTAAITFGQTRYRAPAEGATCLLVAVAVDQVLSRIRGRRAATTDASVSDTGAALASPLPGDDPDRDSRQRV